LSDALLAGMVGHLLLPYIRRPAPKILKLKCCLRIKWYILASLHMSHILKTKFKVTIKIFHVDILFRAEVQEKKWLKLPGK